MKNKVTWAKQANKDTFYSNFRKYLRTVFIYAGSHSLGQELKVGQQGDESHANRWWIHKGRIPRHAVVVLGMADNDRTGERVFLLVRSYTCLRRISTSWKNPTNASLSPWYKRYRWAIRWVHQNGFLRSSIWNALLRKMSKTKNELYGFQANSNPKVILVLDSWCKQHSWQRKKGGQRKPLDPIPLNRRHKDYLMTGIKNEV